jgi:hypothetical protein
MIIRILLFIKHKLFFIWKGIDILNSFLFSLLYEKKIYKSVAEILIEFPHSEIEFRTLEAKDLEKLNFLIQSQDFNRLTFFKPHGFDKNSLEKVFRNKALVMMGAFEGNHMIGYFFLRCFWNRKCFVGRFLHAKYEGKGIGRIMNSIMYNLAWRNGFQCLSTISKNNHWVMKAHAGNKAMRVIKELDNDYLLVEFLPSASSPT